MEAYSQVSLTTERAYLVEAVCSVYVKVIILITLITLITRLTQLQRAAATQT
jgi:hypothetical protein